MAPELTTERRLGAHLALATIGVGVLLVMLAGWRLVTADPTQVMSGVVSVVNAQGTKFCFTPDSGDVWCGRLATSGNEPVTVGQTVTVVVTSVDTQPGGALGIGTVVPAGLTVAP